MGFLLCFLRSTVAGFQVWCGVVTYAVVNVRDDDLVLFHTPPPGEWRFDGACRGMEKSLFYPPTGHRPTQALVICRGCPVRKECAEYALEQNQHWGVWGGLTERQRFDVKRHRREGRVHPLDPTMF